VNDLARPIGSNPLFQHTCSRGDYSVSAMLSWHDMWFFFSKIPLKEVIVSYDPHHSYDPTHFSLYSPTSAPVAGRRPCLPSGKRICWQPRLWHVRFSTVCHSTLTTDLQFDAIHHLSTRISWRKAKRCFLSITQTLGKPFPHHCSRPLTRVSSLIRWHEHDATEKQEVCDKVVEQAIVNLEEAGYKCRGHRCVS
jgi:hypothetical protein